MKESKHEGKCKGRSKYEYNVKNDRKSHGHKAKNTSDNVNIQLTSSDDFEEWTIIAKAKWILEKDFTNDFSNYVDENWHSFEDNARGNTSEHDLKFKELHQRFNERFESRLLKFLSSENSNAKRFFDDCHASLTDKYCALFEEDKFKSFVQFLISIVDYQTFYSIMVKEAAKRLGLCEEKHEHLKSLQTDEAW